VERQGKDAQISIGRIRKVMHAFRGSWESKIRCAITQAWTALAKLDGYLSGQSKWLVNTPNVIAPALRVGRAHRSDGEFLVTADEQIQQMRWTGAAPDCCCSPLRVYNGTLGSGWQRLSSVGASEIPMQPDPRVWTVH